MNRPREPSDRAVGLREPSLKLAVDPDRGIGGQAHRNECAIAGGLSDIPTGSALSVLIIGSVYLGAELETCYTLRFV